MFYTEMRDSKTHYLVIYKDLDNTKSHWISSDFIYENYCDVLKQFETKN